MNKRIRELAEEAEFSEKDLHIQGDNFQRFAELIVQECLYIVEGEDDCGPDTKSVRLAMLRIKQHFGVEE
jgi:hypothetical protein